MYDDTAINSDVLEALQGIRAETRNALGVVQEIDTDWPKPAAFCYLDRTPHLAGLVHCQLHGYQHVRRVVNHVGRNQIGL